MQIMKYKQRNVDADLLVLNQCYLVELDPFIFLDLCDLSDNGSCDDLELAGTFQLRRRSSNSMLCFL